MSIRLATVHDAPQVQAIYAPIVQDSAISFETEPPSVDAMRSRIEQTLQQYPWLVGVDDAGRITGYVYASRYAERAAYRWSVGVTAYVRADQRGRGVGQALYGELLSRLKHLGYCQAYAGITLPNAASVALHEAMGFTPVGVFSNAGHKLGRWHDVGYWQCALQRPDQPAEPRAMSA